MRVHEFLFEASLANSELRKHGGKYIALLIKKITDGEALEVVPNLTDKLGAEITIDPASAKDIAQAYFGQDTVPELDTLSLADNGDVIPANPDLVRTLKLKTAAGTEVPTSVLQKSAAFKGGKSFNTGDISEGCLGAAVTARFAKRTDEITEEDVIKVLANMGKPELVGKNNLFGTITVKSSNDTVMYKLGLNKASYKALIDAAKTGNMPNEIKGAIRSSVMFANTNKGVQVGLERIVADDGNNRIEVNADGVSDQRGTKADLFLDIDGTTINLLSLKAGDVKQFGQVSGYNFDQIEKFFMDTFGVNVDDRLADNFVEGDAKASFDAIHAVYREVHKKIQSELAGDNDVKEAKFVERLYKGIEHHATRGEEGTSLVILKPTPNAPGFLEMGFGAKLQEAMSHVDLSVELIAPGAGKPAKIRVFGTVDDSEPKLLLQLRSSYKSEGKGYVRNIVEMGPLLKQIATIEKAM